MAGDVRIFLVDDHLVVQRGLEMFFQEIPDFVIVGRASGGRDALEALRRLEAADELPNVILMDLVMQDMTGIEATTAVKAEFPTAEVIRTASFALKPSTSAIACRISDGLKRTAAAR